MLTHRPTLFEHRTHFASRGNQVMSPYFPEIPMRISNMTPEGTSEIHPSRSSILISQQFWLPDNINAHHGSQIFPWSSSIHPSFWCENHHLEVFHVTIFWLPDFHSIDWFKPKITGKSHFSWENPWFPVDFPYFVNPSIHGSPCSVHHQGTTSRPATPSTLPPS